MIIPWPRLVEIIRRHRRFALTAHVRPDGDALGSEAAMVEILESLGKDVTVCNPFGIPPNLRFLDPKGKFRRLGVDLSPGDLADREVLIVLDTSAWAQLGAMAEVVKTTQALKVVIDHHQSGDDLGAECFKDEHAEATGCLVVEAADQLGVPLSPGIARAAFVAVATDTGGFRCASTGAGTLQLASRLVEAGAVPDRLYKELYENDSHARLRLIGRTLARSETDLEGRLIYSWLEQSDFTALGAIPSDSEDIINMLLSVHGTEAAVMLVEQPAGGFKVSLRSRSAMDCCVVAERFGGGGHRMAAGAFFNEPLDSARRIILDAVRSAMSSPAAGK